MLSEFSPNCIPVVSISPHYRPVLVAAAQLDILWRLDGGLYVPRWDGPPRDRWFSFDDRGEICAFQGALASCGLGRIGFTNGRHRTRWLLQSGMSAIPICVPFEEMDEWSAMGLLVNEDEFSILLDLAMCSAR